MFIIKIKVCKSQFARTIKLVEYFELLNISIKRRIVLDIIIIFSLSMLYINIFDTRYIFFALN